jgi:hypothetical protein
MEIQQKRAYMFRMKYVLVEIANMAVLNFEVTSKNCYKLKCVGK